MAVDQYIRDAEEAGDQHLSEYFRRLRDEDSMRADEAQLLLAERTPTAAQTEEMTSEASPTVRSAGTPRTEGVGTSPTAEPAGEPARTEEDRGLLDKARDALTGQDEEPKREEPDQEQHRGYREETNHWRDKRGVGRRGGDSSLDRSGLIA